jgi:hypothetical protein
MKRTPARRSILEFRTNSNNNGNISINTTQIFPPVGVARRGRMQRHGHEANLWWSCITAGAMVLAILSASCGVLEDERIFHSTARRARGEGDYLGGEAAPS